jgi:hypothetical protein
MVSLIKQMAIYHDWENISCKDFVLTTFDQLKIGNIVMSVTFTYSQKYFMTEGYEEYNMSKIGILLTKDEEKNGNSLIYRRIFSEDYEEDNIHFEETKFYADPMNSGIVQIYKHVD